MRRPSSSFPSGRVDPRARGWNWTSLPRPWMPKGRSPRGRVKRHVKTDDRPVFRWIPAYAGEALCRSARALYRPVDPRAGGRNETIASTRNGLWGGSPHVRVERCDVQGSSNGNRWIPAWRVKHRDAPKECRVDGRIPARRENIKTCLIAPVFESRSPHMRGETSVKVRCSIRRRVDPRAGGRSGLRQ